LAQIFDPIAFDAFWFGNGATYLTTKTRSTLLYNSVHPTLRIQRWDIDPTPSPSKRI